MAGFGFVRNAFEYAAKKFADVGAPFSEAYETFKNIISEENKLAAFRRYQEGRIFRRMAPFVKKMPGGYKVPHNLFTPTRERLRDKMKYMFEVKIKVTGQAEPESFFYSFLSGNEYSKEVAEGIMGSNILNHFRRQHYREIEELDIVLTGVALNRWVA